MSDSKGLSGLDTLRLVPQRAHFRDERRKLFGQIDAAAAGLESASGGGTGAPIRGQRDFANLKIIGALLTEASDATKTLGGLTKSVAALEAELVAAQSAAQMRKIALAVVSVGTIIFLISRLF